MKLLKLVTTGVVVGMLSTAVLAQAPDGQTPPAMPNGMPGGMQGGMPMGNNGLPMDPAMMQQMRQMRLQRMAQGQGDPMMGGGNNGMMMDPAMMQQMMQMRQQQMGQGGGMGKPCGHHPGEGMKGGMMNPQMMQNMMKMRQQHMADLNNRLDRIESKLDQLLSRQK